jgi:hypothetical protein
MQKVFDVMTRSDNVSPFKGSVRAGIDKIAEYNYFESAFVSISSLNTCLMPSLDTSERFLLPLESALYQTALTDDTSTVTTGMFFARLQKILRWSSRPGTRNQAPSYLRAMKVSPGGSKRLCA